MKIRILGSAVKDLEQAVVYRVLDCRRDPARIRRELGRTSTDVTKEE
jgi:hypothetical protein